MFLAFTLQRGLIICPAVIFHERAWRVVPRMALDTGASYTIIRPVVADQLGFDYSSAPLVQTMSATGPIMLPKITIRQIGIQEAHALDVDVLVGSLPEEVHLDGLLGYSFLQHFNVNIDYRKHILTLKPFEYTKAIEPLFGEWNSEYDENAYRDL